MIDLSGQVVRFYLSGEGRRALKGLVPARGSFQAPVLTTSDLGPLIWRSTDKPRKQIGKAVPVMLIRWDHIATMSFDLEIAGGRSARERIGFRPA